MATPFHDPLSELGPMNRTKIYAELRERMPVYWSSVHAAWILTRYADVSAILRHKDALALDGLPFLQSLCRRGRLDLSNLLDFLSSISLFTRGPRHDVVRRMLAQVLGGIGRLNLPEMLERRADQILAFGECDGSIDLADGYGKALALFVIGTLLGVPERDLPKLSELARDLASVMERHIPSVSTLINLDKRAASLMDYFVHLITLRRQSGGNDGISIMAQLADEQLGCSNRELAGYCTFFFTAAEETTASAISGAALILLEHPALRARLASDPSLLPRAVRELLRLVSPVQYVARQMRVDSMVAGQLIRAGEPIILMLGAANRDPTAFPNPDEPDLDRPAPESFAFGSGPYRCIGAQLAAMEVEVAIRKILERPLIRLSPEAPVWTNRMNIAPLERLQAYFVQ